MNDITKRRPPNNVAASIQGDLFLGFVGNDWSDLSNTIELWDALPKYSVGPRRQANMRDEKGRLSVHEYSFNIRDEQYRLEIQPASLKVDGEYRDFYPSETEELVEDVILKIFATQQGGLHDVERHESWVRFSLSSIRRELQARGKTRTLDQIKHSIEILSNTTIRVFKGDSENPEYTVPILSDVVKVTRDQYLNGEDKAWCARLPALITSSVNGLQYRQFSFGTHLSLPSQLSRWLHKWLSNRYTYANSTKSIWISFNSLRRDSGLLEANRVTKSVKALEGALDELARAEIILHYSKEEQRGARNEIIDVIYRLYAHPSFTGQMKAANKRHKDNVAALKTGNRPERIPPKPSRSLATSDA